MGSTGSYRKTYTSRTIVISMVNFLNTVNMGRLEKTRAESRTSKPDGTHLISRGQKVKPEFLGAGQSRYVVPNIQQRKGENLK